jgi:hypothetical protein
VNAAADHHLLRSWLGLPAGPWPPDYYALLGLTPGPCDPAALETRVLDRMDKLRRHQLLHPELVTEGMNRLAQALICLSDPAAKAAYDAELVTVAAPPPAAEPPPSEPQSDGAPRVTEVPFEPGLLPPGAPPPPGLPPAPPGTLVVALRYEVVPAEELPPAHEVVAGPEVLPLPELDEPVVAPQPPALGNRAARRGIYTRLALVRKALRAWEGLRTLLADPREPFDRPARVLLLLESVREVRPLLPQLHGLVGIGRAGGTVAALVSQPALFDTIRSLLPDQRQAVAIDWRRGQVELQREHRRLRGLSRAGREPRTGPTGRQVLIRWVRQTPEVILILLAVVAFFVALIRGAAGR